MRINYAIVGVSTLPHSKLSNLIFRPHKPNYIFKSGQYDGYKIWSISHIQYTFIETHIHNSWYLLLETQTRPDVPQILKQMIQWSWVFTSCVLVLQLLDIMFVVLLLSTYFNYSLFFVQTETESFSYTRPVLYIPV